MEHKKLQRPPVRQPEKQQNQQSVFHDFYLKLKSEKALPVRKELEHFVKSQLPKLIKSEVSREEQGMKVQDLMSEMEQRFNQIFPPRQNSNVGDNIENDEGTLNGEGIENCVMKNLYQDLFKHPGEAEFNTQYVQQTLIHQRFLKPEHLDLPTGKNARIDPVRIEHAVQQLMQLNKYKTPKAKLTMLINFCRVISIMLQETSLDGQPDGADMFFPSCIYSFMQIEDKQILQDLNTNIQFVKHFRHEERLSGEDEYYLTTLESIAEFIFGISAKDLKIDEKEYAQLVQKSQDQMSNENKIKEEAAQQELADLLNMNNQPLDSSTASSVVIKKDKKAKDLDKVDKVYHEMKQKNKRLKKEIAEGKQENESLRSIFAEFQVEFRQNRKQEKLFSELTIGDLQDVFAIQQKLMAQIQSMDIGNEDLQNGNWAEFDNLEQQDTQPAQIPTTKKQQEEIRRRAEKGESSRSRSRAARRRDLERQQQNDANLLGI